MKKSFTSLCATFCLLLLTSSLWSQSETPNQNAQILTNKQAELLAKKSSMKELESMIEKLNNEIKKLTPVFPQHWDFVMFSTITANYAQYSNWVAGGQNAFSLIGTHDMGLNYTNTEKKYTWQNNFSAMLGYRTDQSIFDEWFKTNDVLNFSSQFAYAMMPTLSVATSFVLRTQLLSTRNYLLDERPVVSSFLSPGFINFGIGVDWKIFKWFNVYLSPLTLQSTVVIDQDVDPVSFGIHEGETSRSELGWYLNAISKAALGKSLSLFSRILLFNNYISDGVANDIDVDWNLRLDAKLSKNFYAFFFINLRYDEDAKIVVKPADGNQPAVYRPANVQSFHNVGLGASYRLSKKL